MQYRNAHFIDPENSAIDMEVNLPGVGWLPFTADPNDTTDYGPVLFKWAKDDPTTARYQRAAE